MSNNQLAITPSFDLSLAVGADLNKDDVLAIGVSAYEQRHEALIEVAKAEVKELESVHIKQKDSLSKATRAAVEKHSKSLEKLLKPMEKLGIKVQFDLRDVNTLPEKVTYNFVASVVQPAGAGTAFGFNQRQEFPVPADVVKARNEFEATGKAIIAAVERGAAARLALTRLPSVERKAKAELAIYGLQQTEQGQKLLAKIQKSIG